MNLDNYSPFHGLTFPNKPIFPIKSKSILEQLGKVPVTKRMNILLAIDKSSSMTNTKSATIQAVNSFVEQQRNLKVKANIEVILFSDKIEILFPLEKLKHFKGLNSENYIPSGMTAIYDAFGTLINKYRDSDNDTILVLLTDGEENSSREFTKERVTAMIKNVQEHHNWEVVFLGANINNFDTYTKSLGISATNSMNFSDTASGRLNAMAYSSNLATSFATTRGYASPIQTTVSLESGL